MELLNFNLSRQINKEATKRELFKYYREAVLRLNEVTDHYNQGRDFYLGHKIRVVLWDASQELEITKAELDDRGIDLSVIKNVAPLISKKSVTQLKEEKATRDQEYLAQQIEAAKTCPLYIINGAEISDEQVKNLILNNRLSATQFLDCLIDVFNMTSDEIIQVAENFKQCALSKISVGV